MKKIKIYLWFKLFLMISISILIIMVISYLFLQNIVFKQFGVYVSEDIDNEKEFFIENLKNILQKSNDAESIKEKNRLDTFIELQELLKNNKYIVSCVVFLNRALVFSYNKSDINFFPFPPPRLEGEVPPPAQFGKEKRFTPPKLKPGYFFEQYIFRLYPLRIYTVNLIFYNEAAKNFLERIKIVFLIFYLVLILLSFPISLLIARQFTKPIIDLTKKTINLSNGNFEGIIENKRIDEIGLLIDAFNKLSSELQKDQQFRKRITSEITHDISTPINIIKSYIYGLNDGIIDINTETIMSIDGEIERINELVDQINLFSSKADVNLDNIPFLSISDEIEIYIEKILYLFKKEKVEIIRDLEENILFKIRRNHLRSLLENILKNSILHNSKQVKIIEVFLYSDNNKKFNIDNMKNQLLQKQYSSFSINKFFEKMKNRKFSILIKDNGNGIDSEELPAIFERFYKGKNTIKDKNLRTSGLGLSIVKEICNLYNINIEIYSLINEGTAIILNFF